MVSYEISCLCGAISLCVGASTIITLETVHPGCVQRQREPCVNMLGCFMKNLMWLLVDITNLLSLLGVCISVSLMSGCLIVCLPAALCLLRFVTCILSLIDVQLTILSCCVTQRIRLDGILLHQEPSYAKLIFVKCAPKSMPDDSWRDA